MRIIYVFIIAFFLTGCTGKVYKTEPVKDSNKTAEAVKQEPATGWSDRDTYTVSVSAADIDKAREAAMHKILQDIVKVRMLNESRYTDITKISTEFDKPLKEGKIISQKNTGAGVEIYFQIRDRDLKEKFERK